MADTRLHKKASKRPDANKRVTFPVRVTIRLDDDVRALLNNSGHSVQWLSQGHAVNAGLRQVFQKFAPPTLRVKLHPFDQLALAKKLKRKTQKT